MFGRNRTTATRPTNRINIKNRFKRFNLQLLEDRAVPATITVTNSNDLVTPGDGVSLREALNSINGGGPVNADVVATGAAYGTSDAVLFQAGLASPINLPSGQLALTKAVTITGPNPASLTVQNTQAAGATSRVFNDTMATGLVFISGLTITGGNGTGNGGGIEITSGGSLTLDNCVLTGNSTSGEGGGISNESSGTVTFQNNTVVSNNKTTGASGDGGGFNDQSSGPMTISNSTFSGNIAGNDGGAVYLNASIAANISGSTFTGNTAAGRGGGIYFTGPLAGATITNCTITLNKNTAGAGGGFYMTSGTLVVTNSAITNNSTSTVGGGIRSAGPLTLTACTVSGNSANTQGGGIYSTSTLNINGTTIDSNVATTQGGGLQTSGTVNLTAAAGSPGSTISNNSSTLGGGWNITGGTVTVRNSTIAKNTATGGTGGGGLNMTTGTLNLQNSTVAMNAAPGGAGGGFMTTAAAPLINLSSSIVANNTSLAGGVDGNSTSAVSLALNNSLIGVNAADNITYTGVGQINVASGLDVGSGLQLNGAPVGTPKTIALLPGSKALDVGNNSFGLTRDERGNTFLRPSGPGTDVGAYEAPGAIPSGTATAPDITTQTPADETITVTYSIGVGVLDGSKMALNNLTNITVTGPGGYSKAGKQIDPTPANAASITVHYTVPANPGGSSGTDWDFGDNGPYTITLNPNQIYDSTDTIPAPSGSIGNFNVAIKTNYIVNATTDSPAGVGVGNTGDLRYCINAFDAGLGLASITFSAAAFPAGINTVTLTSGLTISQSVILVGQPGAGRVTIDGGTLYGVFNITGGTVAMSDMTIAHGAGSSGAGINFTTQTVTLTNVVVDSNNSTGTGGGIGFTTGTLNMTNSTVSNNTSTGNGGGIYLTTGTLNDPGSKILTNRSNAEGGAIFANSGFTIVITDTTISGNTAAFDGAGIYTFGAGTTTIISSTIDNNVGDLTGTGGNSGGGALSLYGGTVTISNSTVAYNTATAGNGGGARFTNAITANVRNSTFAFNSAPTGAGILVASGTTTLSSTIVSNSTGPDFSGSASSTNSLIMDGSGTVSGSPIVGDPGLGVFALNGGTTKNFLPAGGGLADGTGNNAFGINTAQNGVTRPTGVGPEIGSTELLPTGIPAGSATGPTITTQSAADETITVTYSIGIGLLNGSKMAFNNTTNITVTGPGGYSKAGKQIDPTPANASTIVVHYTVPANPAGSSLTDWDGLDNGTYTITLNANQIYDSTNNTAAPSGPIGNFKVAIPVTYVVDVASDVDDTLPYTPNDGTNSLRKVIRLANNDTSASAISFSALFNAPQMVTVGSVMTITEPVTVNAPTALLTLDGSGSGDRAFDINLTTPGGAVSLAGMEAQNFAPATGDGGAIEDVNAALTLTGMILDTNSTTGSGGGVNVDGPSMVANNCTFSNNTAGVDGGGINIPTATVTLNNCMVSTNIATTNGGGIYVSSGTLIDPGTTIAGNQTSGHGGGIYGFSGFTINITNSTITGNTSTSDGGGIYSFGTGATTILSSTIDNNVADAAGPGTNGGGGGLSMYAGTCTISNSTVANNTATAAPGGGGMFCGGMAADIRNSTFAFNSATLGGGISTNGLGGGSANLSSTIVSNSTGTDFDGTGAATNSLVMDGSGTITGSVIPGDPVLGAFALNGGTTKNFIPASGGLADGTGNNLFNINTAQNNVTRPSGSGPEIGSTEIPALPPPTVSNLKIDNGTIQRSMVRSLTVTFSEAVTITGPVAGAFALNRNTAPTFGEQPGVTGLVNIAAVQGPGNTVVITFLTSGANPVNGVNPPGNPGSNFSLPDGRYTLTIDASKVTGNVSLELLDGDFNNTPGGNYVLASAAGPAQATNIFREFGDQNGDGFVGTNDFSPGFKQANGTAPVPSDEFFDYNNNGFIGTEDFTAFKARYQATFP
jgi:fibronectin-binding autotransporter adhesin